MKNRKGTYERVLKLAVGIPITKLHKSNLWSLVFVLRIENRERIPVSSKTKTVEGVPRAIILWK